MSSLPNPNRSRNKVGLPARLVENRGQRNTGTAVRFTPNPKYFDSVKFSVSRLRHVLRAKAVLCPGLRVRFKDEGKGESEEWHYEDGLKDYLSSS